MEALQASLDRGTARKRPAKAKRARKPTAKRTSRGRTTKRSSRRAG
jgi:hypothetical protein